MYRWGKNGGGKGDRLRRIPRSERKSRDRVLINLSIVLAKLRGERREPTRTAFQNFFSPQKFSQSEWKAIDPILDTAIPGIIISISLVSNPGFKGQFSPFPFPWKRRRELGIPSVHTGPHKARLDNYDRKLDTIEWHDRRE